MIIGEKIEERAKIFHKKPKVVKIVTISSGSFETGRDATLFDIIKSNSHEIIFYPTTFAKCDLKVYSESFR